MRRTFPAQQARVIRATVRVALIAWEAGRSRRGDNQAISRRQRARLQELVRHARTTSPYYRSLYRNVAAGPVHLASLPVVFKRDLMAHFDDWVTDPDITIASLRRDFLSVGLPAGAENLRLVVDAGDCPGTAKDVQGQVLGVERHDTCRAAGSRRFLSS